MKNLPGALHLLLVLTVCSLAAQFLLGRNQTLAGFACAGFFLLYLVLLFLWKNRHPPEPLPHGGRLDSPGREGLLYTAADGREMALGCYGGRDIGYTIYLGHRWGFNNGPALSEEERQQIRADIVEYYRRQDARFEIRDEA